MVLAIEPMVNAGTWEVETLDDDWTAVTLDGKLSSHWEHTVLVTEAGPRGPHPAAGDCAPRRSTLEELARRWHGVVCRRAS